MIVILVAGLTLVGLVALWVDRSPRVPPLSRHNLTRFNLKHPKD